MTDLASDIALLHRKMDAVVSVVWELLKGHPMTKAHDDLLALAKNSDKAVDDVIADRASGNDKLEDIAAVVAGTRDKAIAALKADATTTQSAAVTDKASSTTLTVTSATTAPAMILPVSGEVTPVAGSTVSGDGIASGTTVVDATSTSISLSAPTEADHAPGATITVQAPAA